MSDNRPIGVFDSGLGGLTVVRELVRALPREKIVYFGDTGRVPYGDKSAETVTHYARQDERFLLSKDVKLIIAACGTVSSVAAHTGEELPVPFIGVVSPAAKAAAAASSGGCIGVIGTSATVRSGAYEKALLAINPELRVYSADCPVFVPLVEAGWITPGDAVTTETVRRYLTPLREKGVDTLILGCTHYPVLSGFISEFMGPGVTLVNTGYTAAMAASAFLREKGLFSDDKSAGAGEYYVSDRAESFTQIADVLLGRKIDGHVGLVDITRY
ncbi:MAG: glutamate racemase [Candidatus Howiella sp.]|jgi:glutamate racemase